jgi:WD40 repeat protein
MANAALSGSQPQSVLRDLVFISYSHRDKVWLDRLLIFLKPYMRQDLKVWADPYIEVGGEWRRNIDTALTRCCVGVLLLSPDFLASDFIYDQELPPLLKEAGTGAITLAIVPITSSPYETTQLESRQFVHPPDKPLDSLPEHERNAAFVQIVKEIAKAARGVALDIAAVSTPPRQQMEVALAPVAPTGHAALLHGVPDQRPNYLRRKEYLDALKQTVLGATHQAIGITGTTPQGTRIGLHGMGGIGKTVLAIDLVNDDEVRCAFPDGIFWVTLGQTIEPLRLQGELAGYMAGEAKVYATVNVARDQLRQLFDAKACLLVLDDLWRLQDAEPFEVLGPRSRLLVTTRDADLLVALGARELPLDVLSEDLALELLASWSGQSRAALPTAASEVAESCGHLPLALALAGARVAGGARWEDVASALKRGRLEFLDHPYRSVFGSLRLSTDALSVAERERYFELAVFPEDAVISTLAICTLWGHTGGIEPAAARDLLLRLQRRALLSRTEDGERISFHDLQHDFLRLNIASLAAAHAALVNAYRAVAPSGWASGPDDRYFFQNLTRHLAEADRLDELRALLCDYDWLVAKLRATNITAVLSDYDLVANDPDLTLIEQAMRLSTPALARDRLHLPSQLLGRLRGSRRPPVETLLAEADAAFSELWLRPRFASLTPPGGPLRQMLVGHRGPLTAVAVLGNGRRALSGSHDHTLRLWDLETGETLRTLKGHTSWITAVAVLGDGRRALSGSRDHTLRLWDLETGETLRILEGHTHWVSAVAVLGDGRALSGSHDHTLRLWDLETGETLRTFEGHTSWVDAVAVLGDGRRALSGSSDYTLRLWDLETGETLRTLEGHTSGVRAVAVLGDGRRALSGSFDYTLRLWDLETGETLRIFEGHTYFVSAVAVLGDGRRALSGSEDRTLRLWDVETGETLRILENHSQLVNAVAVLGDGRGALSGSFDQTLRLWDLETETLRILEGHTRWVSAVAVLGDGRRALSGSHDNTLRLWDLKTGETLRTLEGHTSRVNAVAVLGDGRCALSGLSDYTLRLWDLETGKTLSILEGHTHWVYAVAVLGDGRRALSGSEDQTLRLWDLETGETLLTLEGHAGVVTAVAVLGGGRRALSGSEDQTLRLWDLETGETLRTLEGHTSGVRAVAVLGDGRRALSGSDDNTLRLWNLETGETRRTLEGHTSGVIAVAVLGNGSRALSGSWDNTLRLWDLASGERFAEFYADAGITSVAFARDDLIVAGSANGRIHILEIREP